MALEWSRGASAKGRDYFNNNYYCEYFVVFLLFCVGHTNISCNLVVFPMFFQLLLLMLFLLLFKEKSERI